jgi:hypothetical protein
LPGLPAVAGKPVHVGFDGGRLTSDGGTSTPPKTAPPTRWGTAVFKPPVNEAG